MAWWLSLSLPCSRKTLNNSVMVSVHDAGPITRAGVCVITRTTMIRSLVLLLGIVCATADCASQWSAANGIDVLRTGMITSLAADTSGVIVAGTERDGVYASFDGGVTWRNHGTFLIPGRVGFGNRAVKISQVVIANGIAYAGVENDGIYRRGDLVWSRIRHQPDSLTVTSMYVDAGKDEIVMGTFMEGVFRMPLATDSLQLAYVRPGDTNHTINEISRTSRGFYIGTRFDGLWRAAAIDAPRILDTIGLPSLPLTSYHVRENDMGWEVSCSLAYALDGGLYVRAPGQDRWFKFFDGIDDFIAYLFGFTVHKSTFFASTGYFGGKGVYTWNPRETQWKPWNDGLASLNGGPIISLPRGRDTVRLILATRDAGIFFRDTALASLVTSVSPQDVSRPPTIHVRSRGTFVPGEQLYDILGRAIDVIRAGYVYGLRREDGTMELVAVTE